MELLSENIGETFQDTGIGDNFLDRTHKAWATKAKPSTWDYVKLRNSCKAKEMVNRVKVYPSEVEKIFLSYLSYGGLIFSVSKLKSYRKETANPIKRRTKDLSRLFSKQEIQRAKKHEKSAQHH